MNIERQNRINSIIQKQSVSSENVFISVWGEIYLYYMMMNKYVETQKNHMKE